MNGVDNSENGKDKENDTEKIKRYGNDKEQFGKRRESGEYRQCNGVNNFNNAKDYALIGVESGEFGFFCRKERDKEK